MAVGAAALRVWEAYHAVPGLNLSVAQAQRLFSLDALTCEAILDALVAAAELRRTAEGRYVLRDQRTCRNPISPPA